MKVTKCIQAVFILIFLHDIAWADPSKSHVSSDLAGSSRPEMDQRQCAVDFREQHPLVQGTLSPFWAQEYVGVDLVEQSIQELEEKRGTPFTPVKYALWDSDKMREAMPAMSEHLIQQNYPFLPINKKLGFNQHFHGTAVASLVSGKHTGAARRAVLDWLVESVPYNNAFSFANSLVTLKERDIPIVSSSTNSDSPEPYEFRALNRHSIIVNSAGNDFPSLKTSETSKLPRIGVSNLNYTGFIEAGSQEEAVIAAPSGYSILTYSAHPGDSEAGFITFGGTSGAQPLVAGALLNTLLVLKNRPTLDQAKQLLENTALPTINALQTPIRNGRGTLNAYKLWRVAVRLDERGWNDLNEEKRSRLLNDKSLYDFENEAKSELESGMKALAIQPCNRKAINMIRKALALSASERDENGNLPPTFAKSARLLQMEMERVGLTSNAQFYGSFDIDTAMKQIRKNLLSPESVLHLPNPDDFIKPAKEAARAAEMLYDYGGKKLLDSSWVKYPDIRYDIAFKTTLASSLSRPSQREWAASIMEDDNQHHRVRIAALDVLLAKHGKEGEKLVVDYIRRAREKARLDKEMLEDLLERKQGIPEDLLPELVEWASPLNLRMATHRKNAIELAGYTGPATTDLLKNTQLYEEFRPFQLIDLIISPLPDTSVITKMKEWSLTQLQAEKLREPSSSEIRLAIVNAAERLPKEGLELMLHATKDADLNVRANAILSLTHFGQQAVTPLRTILKENINKAEFHERQLPAYSLFYVWSLGADLSELTESDLAILRKINKEQPSKAIESLIENYNKQF